MTIIQNDSSQLKNLQSGHYVIMVITGLLEECQQNNVQYIFSDVIIWFCIAFRLFVVFNWLKLSFTQHMSI